jgi:hypothetical protein
MVRKAAKDPKPTPERVLQLAQRVLDGDIVLPQFQRAFVWKKRQIIDLVDSIYRNYPIGSLLVWESTEKLKSQRTIADLEVSERGEKWPVNYLLDGQQRLSTICGVIHWEGEDPRSLWNVAFDLKTDKFIHPRTIDGLPVHQIPLRRPADPSDFYQWITPINDSEFKARANLLFNRFIQYQVPLVTLEDMSITDVAPVFERINSRGTKLTIFDLMRAATWRPEFDLGAAIQDLQVSLAEKRFHTLDGTTFLRALAAASGTMAHDANAKDTDANKDFSRSSIDSLRTLTTAQLKALTESTKISAGLAADFLTTEIGAPRAESLPYANQFAVLCEIFHLIPNPDTVQLQEIKNWFWLTTLSSYFGGWGSGDMTQDAKRIRDFAQGRRGVLLEGMSRPTAAVWRRKSFRSNSAVSQMLALMLGHDTPLDLLNGQKIDIDKSLSWSNDREFHHFFPQRYLGKRGKDLDPNLIANVVLLTSRNNINIRDKAPSFYLREVINDIGRTELEHRLRSNLVPAEAIEAALMDDYDAFLDARSKYLHEHAQRLTGTAAAEDAAVDANDDDSQEVDD